MAIGVDQDVGGLDVAMHDQVRVGIGHGIGDFDQQPDAFAHARPDRIAVRADVLPGNIFAGQPWAAVLAETTIDQARDAGMLKLGEHLTLDRKALRVGVGGDQLQSGMLCHAVHFAAGQVDPAHAAARQQFFYLPCLDSRPGRERARARCIRGLGRGIGEDRLVQMESVFPCLQQALNGSDQVRLATKPRLQEGVATCHRHGQGGMECGFNALVVTFGQAAHVPVLVPLPDLDCSPLPGFVGAIRYQGYSTWIGANK